MTSEINPARNHVSSHGDGHQLLMYNEIKSTYRVLKLTDGTCTYSLL